MSEPIRKIKVGRKWYDVVLYTPSPDTVNSEGFDYETYIKELIREQTVIEYDQELIDLFYGTFETEKSPEEVPFEKKTGIIENYNISMLELQNAYEKQAVNGYDIDINKLMKKVASAYSKALNGIKEKHLKELENDRQAEERKVKWEELKLQSPERIQAYHDGLIAPSDLMAYDIRNLSESDRKVRLGARKIINEVYRIVPDYQEYSMGELYSLYKNIEHQGPQVYGAKKSQGKSK